jgi:uroporphyrinogen decarboxylase
MNNRQRMMAAINRQMPDRIPYTYEALPSTEDKLYAHLGLPRTTKLGDHFHCNRFSSVWDGIGACPSLPERTRRNETGNPNVRIDMWGVRRELITVGDAQYFEITKAPLAGMATVAEIEAYDWPRVEEVVLPDVPAGVDLKAWKQDKVIIDGPIGPFGIAWSMFGLECFMENLCGAPEIVEAAVSRIEAYTLAYMEKTFKKYPGIIDLVGSGDDYGTQQGLLMSPEMTKKYFMSSLKRHYDVGARYGAIGYHHCCGAIFDIIPAMIDAGLKVLNPIQTSANGMDPARLKKHFGKDLCFHGGVDIQTVLAHYTPAEVRAEVRRLIDELGPEGYIIGPSHVMQPDEPPENIVAMYEEIIEYGAKVCR